MQVLKSEIFYVMKADETEIDLISIDHYYLETHLLRELLFKGGDGLNVHKLHHLIIFLKMMSTSFVCA